MKFLFLAAALAAIVGAGVFVLSEREGDGLPEEQQMQVSGDEENTEQLRNLEVTEELAKSIIKNALDVKFDAAAATYTVANIDGKGGPELVIGAAEALGDLSSRPSAAVIQVLALQNSEGKYERLGTIEYTEWLRGAPEVKEFSDIDGDGQKEIVVSLQYGGASSWTIGILDVDFLKRNLHWVLVQQEGGSPQDALFTLAASAFHSAAMEIRDVDGDGRKEIAEIFAQTLFDKTECSANVHVWNGTLFRYDSALSQQILEQLTPRCEFPG